MWLVPMSHAQSETKQRATKLIKNWKKWVRKHSISKAAIAVSFEGKLVAEYGFGRSASDLAPVASLSKSITGICVAKLVQAGKLSFETKLNDVVPDLDSTVSIASLLTHVSGYTHDITQKPAKYKGHDKEYLEWVSRKEIEKGRKPSKIGKFRYNNSNYAMLGAVIRKITGKSYEQACAEIVFAGIGISDVDLNPDWRIMSAWGGWRLSALDYLKFVNTYFDKRHVLGASPFMYPHFKFDNGLRYGMGYNFRTGRKGGNNFWHNGRWHANRCGKKYRFGAYFVSFDNGWSVSANYDISALNNEDGELDRLIAEATHLPL